MRPRGWREDRGANLVEFALVMPFLLLLLLGIIEFAWLFSQNLDVRHGAREGARLAAVNYPVGPVSGTPTRTSSQTDLLIAEVCNRMDVASEVSVSLTSSGAVGDSGQVVVSAPAQSLTHFLDWAIPDDLVLSSEVEIRIEQPAGWANSLDQDCP